MPTHAPVCSTQCVDTIACHAFDLRAECFPDCHLLAYCLGGERPTR